MNLPSLRQLQYLVAVVELRHFGNAARQCHVSQSTLSAGIYELESTLGQIDSRLSQINQELTALQKAGVDRSDLETPSPCSGRCGRSCIRGRKLILSSVYFNLLIMNRMPAKCGSF